MVILDALVNNADRKGGHVLRRADGSVAGIDHGVTFHAENKLRTVLWGWAGEPIPTDLLAEVADGAEAFRVLVEEWGSDTPHRAAHLSRRGGSGRPGTGWRCSSTRAPSRCPERSGPSLPWPPM